MGKGKRYEHVEDILKAHTKSGETVLEIGCGGAVYKDLFDNYVGIDLPGNPYEQTGDVDVYCSGETLCFKHISFDLIFTVATFLIIPDSEKVLNECKRVLRRGGKFIIFDYNYKTCKRLKALDPNHRHIWSPFKLASIVKNAGFKASIIYDYYSTSEKTARWKRLLGKLRLIRCLKFIATQILRREGWNIVIGRKL